MDESQTFFKFSASRISYLDITLDVDHSNCLGMKLCDLQLKMLIDKALLMFYGEVGRGIVTEIIDWDESSRQALVRVLTDFTVKVSNAITLCSSFQGNSCTFSLNEVSDHLMTHAALD